MSVSAIDLLAGPPGMDGPFSMTLANVTITGTGRQYFRVIGLSPGVVEVSGQLLSHGLMITISATQANVPGGPVRGTFGSIDGPVSNITPCGIQYVRSTATMPVAFRFQFTLTGSNQPQNDPTACRGSNL